MADHYSDYLKKSVSASDLVFDKVQESDKDVIKRIKKSHIRSNLFYIIIVSIGFIACSWYFVNFCLLPLGNIIYEVITLGLFGAAVFMTGYILFGFIRGIKEIRRGVVLASSREQENRDGRNTSYQFVFDIYFEDRDETLMSYTVDKEVSAAVQPGDGVILTRFGRSIKVYEDPDRKGVMDVSRIKSGLR